MRELLALYKGCDMITFLSSPKPFIGLAQENQVRAIRSWLAVAPDVEVILYGDSEGAHEVCAELGVRHITDVQTTELGIPYFNSIIEHARWNAKYDIQVYLNCDILLTASFFESIKIIPFQQFLMIGQRIDLGEGVTVDPSSDMLVSQLADLAYQCKILLHGPSGIDYFAFKRGMWDGLPPVVIGRAGYDGALLAYCMRNRVPLIDATLKVLALHQWHDYGHTSNGRKEVWWGKDAMQNRRLSGTMHSAPLVSDAQWEIHDDHLIESRVRGDSLRAMELNCRFDKGWEECGRVLRMTWRLLTAARIYKTKKYKLEDILK